MVRSTYYRLFMLLDSLPHSNRESEESKQSDLTNRKPNEKVGSLMPTVPSTLESPRLKRINWP